MKKYVNVGGVHGSPVLRVSWVEGDELQTISQPLTRPEIEVLLKQLVEALPNAPDKRTAPTVRGENDRICSSCPLRTTTATQTTTSL